MKGYRRLKAGEIVEKGDKYISLFNNGILTLCSATIGNIYDGSGKFYRKIEQIKKPKPSMWIEVVSSACFYQYVLCRRNGKGVLQSELYKERSACIWMAKRTAKALGVEYRGGK